MPFTLAAPLFFSFKTYPFFSYLDGSFILDVCVANCRMVIGVFGLITLKGKYLSTGSSRCSLPNSCAFNKAIPIKVLEIEAIF